MSVIDLGTIVAGKPCKLKVSASSPDNATLFFRLARNKSAGELPQGLKISQDGTIMGRTTFRNSTTFDKGTTTFTPSGTTSIVSSTTWDSSFYFTVEAYSSIGPLASIDINEGDGGSGYDYHNPPKVLISGGGGIQATADAIVDGDVMGEILSLNNYGAADASRTPGTYLAVLGTTSGSGTINPTFNIIVDATGAVSQVTLTGGGAGHAIGDVITISDSDLGGGGAIDFTMDVSKVVIGAVTSITITNPGEGYTHRPTITITDSLGIGTGATASNVSIRGGFGISDTQEYSLRVVSLKAQPWQDLYCIALPHFKDRLNWKDFTSDFNIFDQKALYRKNDERFGLQRDIRILVKSGLNPKYLETYMHQLEEYHHTKPLRFGELKSARSYVDGKVEYEIIYYEIEEINASTEELIDLSDTDFDFAPVYADSGRIRASLGDHAGVPEYTADKTTWDTPYDVYPNSFFNMRKRLTEEIGEVVSEAKSLPSWMSTTQEDGSILQYQSVAPLAYVMPGEAERIKFLIKRSKFNPNSFLFQVDRYEWDKDLSLSYDIDVDTYAIRKYTTWNSSTTTFDDNDMKFMDVTQTITGTGSLSTFSLEHYIDGSNEIAIFGASTNTGLVGKLTPVKHYSAQFKSITFNFTPLNNDKYYVVFTEYAPQTYHKVGEKDKYMKFPQTGVYE